MPPARCLLLLFTLVTSTRLVAAEEVRKATAEGMTTKVFKLPFNFNGFSQLGDPPPAPPQPQADPFAPSPVLDGPQEKPAFKTSRKILEECGVTFPEGASAVFDPVTRELTLHNTPEMHELTQAFIDTIAWHGSTPTIASTLTVVEGPGALIREANAAASRDADATPQLEELLAAAARSGSGVRVVGETMIELNSGTRGTVEAVRERPQVIGFKKKTTTVPPATGTGMGGPAGADQEPEPEIKRVRQDGLRLEMESHLREYGKTLEITLSVDLGPEGAAEESEGAPTLASAPAGEGLRKACFRTGISSISGSTKLIGITLPTGAGMPIEKAPDADTLWAVFLSNQVRRVEPPPCAIAPPGLPPEKLPAGLRAAAFRVPEGLLEPLIPRPFDYRDAPLSLRTWLATQGVSFPTGASMEHRDGLLQVVSTPEDIEIIAALVEQAWEEAPHSLAFTLHTFQVPASLLRQLRREAPAHADDTALLAGIESAVEGGKATPISSTFFQGKPGIRCIHESGRRHGYLAQFGTTDAASQARLAFQEEIVGSFMEVEPIVSADGRTLSLNYRHELHPAPPTGQRQRLRLEGTEKDRYHDLPAADFHVLRSIAGTSMASGGTKLISLHSPTLPGHAEGTDMLWATFLQAHVVPQVDKSQAPQKEKLPALDMAIAASPGAHLIEKMNRIIFPSVTFQATPVDKALEYLSAKSRDYDTSTKDNSEKGVSIVLRLGDAPGDAPVTLDLKDVPMSEALRYVTELAQMAYTVEEHAVLVRPSYQVNAHLHTRSFRVPSDFMSIGIHDSDVDASADPFAPAPAPPAAPSAPAPTRAADPFGPAPALVDAPFGPPPALPADPFAVAPAHAAKVGSRKVRKTAKQILESQGITFPEGASATFIAASSTLVVRNTQPNLDLVEAFTDTTCCYPRILTTTAITAQVLQGPGPLLRRIAAQAAPLNDHRAMLDELLAAVKAGTVQPLDTARIETKYGTRAVAEQGRERAILTGITLAEKDGGSPKLHHSASNIGLRLEAEPIIEADGILVNLTLAAEFHTAPPVERAEHLLDAHGRRTGFTLTDTHLAKIVTGTTLPSGHARLLHLWKPTGKPELEKEDVLQVIFITCDILRGPQE